MAVKVWDNYNGILYDYDGSNGYLKYGDNDNYQGSISDYREPDIVSAYDGGEYDIVKGKITLKSLIIEYNTMIESIMKYKGFYVARYEAGLDKETNEIVFLNASVQANNIITTDASNSQTLNWYGLYQKIKTFTTNDDKVVSGMIWGSQYDAMMNWMAKCGKKIGTVDDTKRNENTVSGKDTNDVINNVFDLYGGHREWTMETYNTFNRVNRGGSSEYSNSPIYRTGSNLNDTNSNYSSRATLYIK